MLPGVIEPTPFAAVMQQLGISNRRARKILEGRISLSAVKHWRAGRAKPPAWVFEILDRELAAIENPISGLRKTLVHASGPGKGWNKTGNRPYRLHRLAQKEKARD